jgi:hypothetical protein
MPGGGRRRRPLRKVTSIYMSTGVDDEAEDELPLVELSTRSRTRRSSTRELFPPDDDQDGGGEDGVGEDGGEDGGGEGGGCQDGGSQGGSGATPAETSSSGSRKPYQRGITRLPSTPLAVAHRPLIRPEGPK